MKNVSSMQKSGIWNRLNQNSFNVKTKIIPVVSDVTGNAMIQNLPSIRFDMNHKFSIRYLLTWLDSIWYICRESCIFVTHASIKVHSKNNVDLLVISYKLLVPNKLFQNYILEIGQLKSIIIQKVAAGHQQTLYFWVLEVFAN